MGSDKQAQTVIHPPYNETPSLDPTFYRGNTFLFNYPDLVLRWLRRLSPSCLTAIRSIRVFVHAVYNPGPAGDWLTNKPAGGPQCVALFEYLAAKATSLKHITIYLDQERTMGHWGGGNDTKLLQAIGKLQTLDTFELRGFFARQWPSYLRGRTSCEVWKAEGQAASYLRELDNFQRVFDGSSITSV